MIESVYSLFSAHTDMEGGAVKCNSDASPTVVVATLSVNCPSSDASQGDESIQHLLSKLSEAYPSSSYMLAVGGPANTSTEARELLGELTVPHGNPKNFCCVVFDESRRPEVLVSGVNAFNPTWLDELREVLDDIQTPIQMVALLVIHMKFSMLLESFFQLIEECRRMGHTSTAGKLLSVVLRHINLSPETELTAMHRLECLKMSCSTVVEKNAIGDTSTDEFLVGIRVHGIPRSLAAVAGTAKGMEVEGLEPRRLLLVLHTGTDNAIGGIKNFGNCHKPLDELDALLQQLNLNDEVFISLAGRVTLPPTSVALARQQWRNMREIAMASLKHNFTAAIPMVTREIFGQTVPVLKKWRRKLLGQKIRRDTGAASPRIMVVLFTSQKPILIHGLVHSIISQEMLFFHVPIFCVSSSCGDPREAYKLLDLTSPGSVHCIETIDSDADVTLSPVEASRNNGKHDDDREISCSSTRGYLQQRPQAMRSIELLTLLLVATIRNTTHTGVSIILPSDGELCEDIYLDMGNIFSVLDRTLFISRAVDSLKNAAKLKRKAIFVAYSLDKEMYEIAYLTPTEIKGEIPSSDRPWWDRLKKSRKLLSSMPNDIRPTVSDCASSELLQSSAGGETFKCFMKQQENLAEWLTLNYNMLQLKGTPYIVVAGWYPNQKLRGCDGEGDAVGDSEQNINKLSPAAFPLVDSRWTNFATYDGAPITTIHAMLSRTFPFETLIERTASRTLALESLQNNCAAVRLASVKHAPALEHAQARLVALMSVDVSNGAMTLVRLMPAKSANDVRSGALHEMKDLRLQQMYCVVHLALRCSMTSDFFMRDDLLIADGISFFTARASVKNVKITSVTHRTADMMWEGTAEAVHVRCIPLRWLQGGGSSKTAPISIRSETIPVELEHCPENVIESCVQGSSSCVIAGLQPFTLYHVRVSPLEKASLVGTLSNRKIEECETYFATCVDVTEEALLHVDKIVREGNLLLSLSYPFLRKKAALNPFASVFLTVTPVFSIDGDLAGKWLTKPQYKRSRKGKSITALFTLPVVERVSVSVAFYMKLCFNESCTGGVFCRSGGSDCGSDHSSSWSGTCVSEQCSSNTSLDGSKSCGMCIWAVENVSPWVKEVAVESAEYSFPSQLIQSPTPRDALNSEKRAVCCEEQPVAAESETIAQFGGNEVSCDDSVVVEDGEVFEEARWSQLSLTHTHDGSLRPSLAAGCSRDCCEVEVEKSEGNGEEEDNIFSEYSPFSGPTAPNGICFLTNMYFKVLLAQFLEDRGKRDSVSAVVLPLNVRIDNYDGERASMKVSYRDVSNDQPLTVKLIQHIEHRYHHVAEKSIELYAVTNVRYRCLNGFRRHNRHGSRKLLLSWTCAAQQSRASLVVFIGNKKVIPGVNNTVTVDCGDFPVAVPLRFCGPNIIREVCPIFLVPAPPPLSPQTCTVKLVNNEELNILIAETYMDKLHHRFGPVRDALAVLLFMGTYGAEELPLSRRNKCGDECGVMLRIPLNMGDTVDNVIALYVDVREKNSSKKEDDNKQQSSSEYSDNDSFGCSSWDGLASTNMLEAPQKHPVLFIPWSRSAPFEAHVASSFTVKNLQVASLYPTAAKITWATASQREHHGGNHGVYLTLRCGAVKAQVQKHKEYIICSKQSLAIRGLTPATPYLVEISLYPDGPSEKVMFVTPQDTVNCVLQQLLPTIHIARVSRRGRNWRHYTKATGESNETSDDHRLFRLELRIPRSQKKNCSIPSQSGWFMGSEGAGCCGAQLCLSTDMHVLLVAESGKLLQLWSTVEGSESQLVSFAFSSQVDDAQIGWPHIELKVSSLVSPMSDESTEQASGTGPSFNRQGLLLIGDREHAREVRVCHHPSRKHRRQGRDTLSSTFHVTVHIIGCPQMLKMDEQCCVVIWSGSCTSYVVHWRAGPCGVIHTEYVDTSGGTRPSLLINITDFEAVVLLFCVHGANCSTNSLLFAALVPPNVKKIMEDCGCYSAISQGLWMPESFTTGLVNVEFTHGKHSCTAASHGEHGECEDMGCGATRLCCVTRVVNASSNDWKEGFDGLLKDKVCCLSLPSSPEVVWLNPVTRVFFPCGPCCGTNSAQLAAEASAQKHVSNY